MNVKPGVQIGEEVHDVDQFIRIEAGEGIIMMDGQKLSVGNGFAEVISTVTRHDVINTSSSEDLKVYSLHCPPEHKEGTVHRTKKDADADDHHHF